MSTACITNVALVARAATSTRASKNTASRMVARGVNAKSLSSVSLSSVFSTGFSAQTAFNTKTSESAMQFVVRALAEDGAATGEEAKVYVGNISWGTDDDALRTEFETFGNVEKCEVVMDANGRSRGFAFVTMSSSTEATAAIEALNNTELDGRSIKVDKVLPAGERAPRAERGERAPRQNSYNSPHRLYVGNLPWRFDDYDLEDTFAEFGEIVDAKVLYDRETGRSRGFGFVTLDSDDSVEAAIEALDGADVDGRTIRVNRADRN